MGKPTTIILRKEHSDKITPSDVLLYTQTRASLGSHQRTFFLQYTVTNTVDNIHGGSTFGILSSKEDVLPNSPQGSGIPTEEETGRVQVLQGMVDSKEAVPSRFNRTGRHMTLQRLWQHSEGQQVTTTNNFLVRVRHRTAVLVFLSYPFALFLLLR